MSGHEATPAEVDELRLAAAQGHANAEFKLGFCYMR